MAFVGGASLVGGHRAVAVSPRRQVVRNVAAESATITQLESLKKYTVVVEDTGDLDLIQKHKPMDATTNPSLVYKAAGMDQYQGLVDEAIAYAQKKAATKESQLYIARDKLATLFGAEITKLVPGYVSTEVDADLSFDVDGMVAKAHKFLELYEEAGVSKDRILIKLASTWEGLKACEILQKEGVTCNMTLIFSLAQAAVAAEVGATLISPFVGRITDWYKKAQGVDAFAPQEDPGVKSVHNIYQYFKCMDYETIVMGASFRTLDQILWLAGCDRLTISPKFIEEMANTKGEVEPHLFKPHADSCDLENKMKVDEKSFRWEMNESAMATEKLAEGIRGFQKDTMALDERLFTKL